MGRLAYNKIHPMEKFPDWLEITHPVVQDKHVEYLDQIAKKLEKRPGGLFNGDILWALSTDEEVENNLLCYSEAQFSWRLLRDDLERGADFMGRSLGVGTIIQREDGAILWAKRGPRVLNPGVWSLSAAGAVEVPNFRVTALREIREELGIDAFDIRLEPLAYLLGERHLDCLLYGRLRSGAPPLILHPGEVSAICWAHDPEDFERQTGEKLPDDMLYIWESLGERILGITKDSGIVAG